MERSVRILYVEDNPMVREMTTELLVRPQRAVAAFGTAEEALDEFRGNGCDIVITDVSLPVMSGIELARNIRREHPQFPIIIASGYALEFGVENWARNIRCIVKPFAAEDIDALIGELLRA
jgi:CheY-like chemotaxis protein